MSPDAATGKHIIDFDHHTPEFRENMPEIVQGLLSSGCPLGWSEKHGGFWAVYGYDALYEAVQAPELFSSVHGGDIQKGVPPALYPDPLIPIDYDGEIQQDFRKMVLSWFNPGTAKALEPRVRAVCTELINSFIESGAADLSQDLFTPLPARLTLEMLGWEVDRWPEWIKLIHAVVHDRSSDPAAAEAAGMKIYELINAETSKRRDRLGTDLFSDMMRSEVNGVPLTDDQVRDFAFLVLLGGMDTTAGATGNTMLDIDRDPKLRKQLLDDLDFIPKAIEEFLRVDGPAFGLYRTVARDEEFYGQPLRKGERVMFMFPAANRDPKMFPDPETIDIKRTNNRHMAFGMGPHRCLGSHHARIFFSTMLREVLTRLPDFTVQRDRVERFHDSGDVYAVRSLPVTFTPGPRLG
jgi:cytochrome P450